MKGRISKMSLTQYGELFKGTGFFLKSEITNMSRTQPKVELSTAGFEDGAGHYMARSVKQPKSDSQPGTAQGTEFCHNHTSLEEDPRLQRRTQINQYLEFSLGRP